MMTESILLGKRLNMATRARRRRLVAAVYTWLALCLVVWYYFYAISLYAYAKGLASLCLFLAFVPFIAFWAITGDMLARGDERETHRRDHAHFVAYRSVGFVTVAELFAVFQLGRTRSFRRRVRCFARSLTSSPTAVGIAALFLYLTLPQAILLWTEPDMDTDA